MKQPYLRPSRPYLSLLALLPLLLLAACRSLTDRLTAPGSNPTAAPIAVERAERSGADATDIVYDASQMAELPCHSMEFTIMGRFGNTLLVNGQPNYEQVVDAGSVVRFYLVIGERPSIGGKDAADDEPGPAGSAKGAGAESGTKATEAGAEEDEHGAEEDGHGPIEWEDEMLAVNRASKAEGVHWMIRDRLSGAMNHQLAYTFRVGDVVRVRLHNLGDSIHPMQHPIHFHGQRLMILSRNGEVDRNPVWKDTILTTPGETVELLMEITNPGAWMVHCHIAEHLETGMMFQFQVLPADHTTT